MFLANGLAAVRRPDQRLHRNPALALGRQSHMVAALFQQGKL